ncbi:MAG: TrmH family RNA methyltransferase [Egibacteraceae bacterium]
MTVVTSTTNSAVKAARKLAARRGRARANAFLVEGPQIVGEAAGCLRRLFVTPPAAARESRLIAHAARSGVDVVYVTENVLAAIADTVTPQGIVGVATLPPISLADVLQTATLLVVGVGVADPGNVGTIIRTADAAGADAVVLTRGSVDARNPKAVRASAGSLFHLPVLGDIDFDAVVAGCHEQGLALVATHPRSPVVYTDVDLCASTSLVFGNEAHGLPRAVLAVCDVTARVPVYERAEASAESLNLATTVAIVVYEAVRQRAVYARDRSHPVGSGP